VQQDSDDDFEEEDHDPHQVILLPSVKPKQGLSPYMIFVKENRQRVKDENEGITFGQVGKQCGAEWGEQPKNAASFP
jgi:hypothetical protein